MACKVAVVLSGVLISLMASTAISSGETVFRYKAGLIERPESPAGSDFDGDGIEDGIDPDDDNDGVPDETDPEDHDPNVPGDDEEENPYDPDPDGDPGFETIVDDPGTYENPSEEASEPLRFWHKSTSENRVCFEASGGYGNYTFFTNILATSPWPTSSNPNDADWLDSFDIAGESTSVPPSLRLHWPWGEGDIASYGEYAEETTADGGVCFRYTENGWPLTDWEFEIYVEDWRVPDSAWGELEGEWLEPEGSRTLRVRFNVVE